MNIKNMTDKVKKLTFVALISLASVILLSVGSTYAYFSVSLNSVEDAVSVGAAVFHLTMKDDLSLIKENLIPSAEEFVTIASTRIDKTTGDFIRPYNKNEVLITKDTVCIDDNGNEICSIYSVTIENPMTDMDLPLQLTLIPSYNSFDNLYFKVLEVVENENNEFEAIEVVHATPIFNNRDYTIDANLNKAYIEELAKMPIQLEGINKVLPKSPDKDNLSSVTYSVVFWIMETGQNQTYQDSNQLFAGAINVSVSGADGQGLTGVFSVGGTE